MDNAMVTMLRDAGLAGVIAVMAWWALKEVFKRIDRALDQMQVVIDKIDSGFSLVRDNSTAQSGAIQSLIKEQTEHIIQEIRGK